MKSYIITVLILLIFSFVGNSQKDDRIEVNKLIDKWHSAAANVDQKTYFDILEEGAIFIGTDATENWSKEEFFEWATPHFNSGKAWSFEATTRNLYFSDDSNLAWFDEQLKYSDGMLRGSGILIKKENDWKIKHYVLSLPVPNEKYSDVLNVINSNEDILKSVEDD